MSLYLKKKKKTLLVLKFSETTTSSSAVQAVGGCQPGGRTAGLERGEVRERAHKLNNSSLFRSSESHRKKKKKQSRLRGSEPGSVFLSHFPGGCGDQIPPLFFKGLKSRQKKGPRMCDRPGGREERRCVRAEAPSHPTQCPVSKENSGRWEEAAREACVSLVLTGSLPAMLFFSFF